MTHNYFNFEEDIGSYTILPFNPILREGVGVSFSICFYIHLHIEKKEELKPTPGYL